MKLLSRSEEIILLAIRNLKDNAYGVTIRDLLSRITDHEWTFGAIYVPLDKLTRKGYVYKSQSEPTGIRGGRSRCLYELSPEGEEALHSIRRVEEALWQGNTDLSSEEEK